MYFSSKVNVRLLTKVLAVVYTVDLETISAPQLVTASVKGTKPVSAAKKQVNDDAVDDERRLPSTNSVSTVSTVPEDKKVSKNPIFMANKKD